MSEDLPAGSGLHVNSAPTLGAQVSSVSPAEKLTHAIGGTWHRRLGRCTCPVCGRQRALIIEDGSHKPLVSCIKGCSGRTIISIARARGWL
jgi:hypothetical protein